MKLFCREPEARQSACHKTQLPQCQPQNTFAKERPIADCFSLRWLIVLHTKQSDCHASIDDMGLLLWCFHGVSMLCFVQSCLPVLKKNAYRQGQCYWLQHVLSIHCRIFLKHSSSSSSFTLRLLKLNCYLRLTVSV